MPQQSDEENWAPPVEELHVGDISPEALNLNVEGRQLTGPLQGFGQMWQKTYRVKIGDVKPEEVISTWKAEYGEFWPATNRFYAPITGIKPGEVGVINAKQGPVKLSTGVFVLYVDDTSFSYMTPQGHPFAGWITFSAFEEDDETIAQVQLLMRANDPLYEAGFMMGGSRTEDKMWHHTLRAVAEYFGSDANVEMEKAKVDRKRQWERFGNVRYNSMIRTWIRKPVGWGNEKG
ncbi:MAG: hypothetical protein ACE5MI_13405 [Acidimicrobiia bacterium]